jgi:putative FmdB family regulatory protein
MSITDQISALSSQLRLDTPLPYKEFRRARPITLSPTLLNFPVPLPKFTPFKEDRRYDVGRRNGMSQYAFHCADCNKEFTQQHHISEMEKANISCPNCGSKNVHQLVSAFSAVTSKKS